MKCKKFVDSISDYLDSTLPGHTRLEFEIHQEKCPECASQLAKAERLLLSLRSLGSQESPIDNWPSVSARISQCTQGGSPWYNLFLRPVVAAPALAVSLIVYLVVSNSALVDTGAQTQSVISTPEYSTYLSAHSDAMRMRPLSDPEISLVQVELEKANLVATVGEK